MKLVIIGTGIAALSAAEAFRKLDTESDVLMLGSDRHLPYFRIKLSHLLSKPDVTIDEVLVKKEDWYREQRITLRTNASVAHIDFETRNVRLVSGEHISYDRLLLATGATPFVPPVPGADKPGVFTLRTFDDLRTIQDTLRNKRRVLVVGGGLLGLEAAYGLMGLGREVHVLEAFPYLLPRQLDPYTSESIRSQLVEMGMCFTLGIPCERIESTRASGGPGEDITEESVNEESANEESANEESVTGMRLKDGSFIEADAILFSAGVRPDTILATGSSLRVNRGIVVDTSMRTNLPDVFAAGDVAEVEGMLYGLWAPALEQGKVAGINLAGGTATYAPTQMAATLSIGRVKLFSAGEIQDADTTISHEEDPQLHRLYVKEGKVAGAVLTGDLSLSMKAKALVLQRKDLPHPDALKVRFHDLFR